MADATTLPEVLVTAPRLPNIAPPANFRYLRPASWKGIAFGVTESELGGGRKVALHQYAFRDEQWPEDLGRRGRILRLQGFLVDGGGQYGGVGSIQQQAAQLLQICETAGPGYLVHPLYGQLWMQLGTFETRHAEAPGVLQLRFEFAEYGRPLYPQVAPDTPAQSRLAAFAAMAKAAQSWSIGFIESVHTALGDGAVGAALQSLSSTADTVATTATSLVNMVGTLPGEFGRFVGETIYDAQKTATSVDELSGMGAASRASVQAAAAALLAAADAGEYVSPALSSATAAAAAGSPQAPSAAVLTAIDVVDVASGVQALIQAVQAANPDPAQQVQACLALGGFSATAQPSLEQTAANAAITALVRRMALAAAAQSSASYVPTSQQDAARMRELIILAIDAEMLIAGDAGDDGSYLALRDLRSCVAADMAARGASLPRSVQVTFAAPLPSLVLAQMLYQDPTREAELVHAAGPVSPLFMPLSFSALAS